MPREPFGVWLGRYWHVIASLATVLFAAFVFLFSQIRELQDYKLLTEYVLLGLCDPKKEMSTEWRSLVDCRRRREEAGLAPPPPIQ